MTVAEFPTVAELAEVLTLAALSSCPWRLKKVTLLSTGQTLIRHLPLLVLAVVTVVKLKCPYCGYVWDYKGKHRGYATCPSCLRKVDIEQNRVE